ncbi:MAG: hypothetical protein IH991_06275 [Planctomycetes bacterium]|nr:hypothetical protein [Planctomycetota bacterium]
MFKIAVSISFAITLLLFAVGNAVSQDATPEEKKQRSLKQFSMIFNYGYAGDNFPQDADQFEKVVVGVKKANYNAILCRYEDWRAEICKKYGIKILADLLVGDHHVYKSLEGCKTLCEKLRGKDVVLGYHLWSDRVGSRVAGRVRDSNNVHGWDPTHLTYVGTYRVGGNSGLTGVDVHGYYDKHVERGGHFPHLTRAWAASQKIGSPFFRYIFYGGQYGRRPNRTSYTVATSIAFGLKGYLPHYIGGTINKATGELDVYGKMFKVINGAYTKVGPELIRIGIPKVVYSTQITMSWRKHDAANGNPDPAAVGLKAVPADYWVQVEQGDSVFGVFDYDKDSQAIWFANHNAYNSQEMNVAFVGAKKVSLFDRATGEWKDLAMKNGTVSFTIPGSLGELVRVAR